MSITEVIQHVISQIVHVHKATFITFIW